MKMSYHEKLRFFSKVKKTESCWLWQGATDHAGYGLFSFSGKTTKATRLIYREEKGEIPEGWYICHTCDIPGCVNPEHLWAGTPQQNAEDASRKHRLGKAKGETQGSSKLTEKDVEEIRDLLASKLFSHRDIGNKYGVSAAAITCINVGKTWTISSTPVPVNQELLEDLESFLHNP